MNPSFHQYAQFPKTKVMHFITVFTEGGFEHIILTVRNNINEQHIWFCVREHDKPLKRHADLIRRMAWLPNDIVLHFTTGDEDLQELRLFKPNLN